MRKDWIAREMTIEVVVGTFLLMILLGLGYFTIIIGKHKLFQPSYRLEILFQNVMGLKDGDRVVARGMNVGKVADLQLQDNGVHVVTELDVPVDLKKDYVISIMSSSVLGGKHLSIYEGGNDSDDISEDILLVGQEPYDLMADAAELMSELKESVTEKGGVVDNLKSAVASLNNIATRVSEGKGTLGKLIASDGSLYDDLAATVKALQNVSERLEKGEGTVGKLFTEEKLYNDFTSLISRLDNIAETVEKGDGNIGMLISRDDLYTNLVASVNSTRNIMKKIEDGDGMLGKLVNDEELYVEIKSTVEEARAAVDDLRESTPIVTFTSVFFGAF